MSHVMAVNWGLPNNFESQLVVLCRKSDAHHQPVSTVNEKKGKPWTRPGIIVVKLVNTKDLVLGTGTQ